MRRKILVLLSVITVPLAAALAAVAPASAGSVIQESPGTSLSSIHVVSGNTYEFQRGSTYTGGPLVVNQPNVTISAYGTGSTYPVFKRTTDGNDITLSGGSDTVSNIRLEGTGYFNIDGHPTGDYEIGIDVTSDNNTIDSDKACGTNAGIGDLYAGVYLESSASGNTVLNTVLLHCDALNPSNTGSGAFGVLIWGDNNTLNHDTFTDQYTPSPDFGEDGSGVEIYNGANNLVENSSGTASVDFTELGSDRSATAIGNVYTSNTFTDGTNISGGTGAPGGDEFLVTRGSGDTSNGPVFNTTMNSNTITLTQSGDEGVVSYDWQSGDSPLITMNSNTVDVPSANTALSTDGGCVTDGHNTNTGSWRCQA